jgi:RluA family pseudouridine synthase
VKWIVPFPQRLIDFLSSMQETKISGKSLRKALSSNLCRVNGGIERFASTQLRKGDRVELSPLWKKIKAPLDLKILYEDESLLLVDKPAGWICDPIHCLRTLGKDRFLIHRLDKETTGVLAIAKSVKVRDQLMAQFASRKVEKKYLAIADGIFRKKDGVQDTLLSKKSSYEGQTIWGSGPRGLQAITEWSILSEGTLASLVLCKPLTGRTHQIRVHLAELGHPILIDRQYAANYRAPFFATRTLLHASFLQLDFDGKKIEALSPLPSDMKEALSCLGLSLPCTPPF